MGVEFHAQADSAVTDAADAQDSSRRCGMPGRGCDQKSDVKHLPTALVHDEISGGEAFHRRQLRACRSVTIQPRADKRW